MLLQSASVSFPRLLGHPSLILIFFKFETHTLPTLHEVFKMTSFQQQQQRSVSFYDAVECIRTLHINDYTDEEVLNTWFTQREYQGMKQEVKLTVDLMNKKATFEEDVSFSSRGLENKADDAIVEVAEHRYDAMDAVLDEQDRQQEAGVCDPHTLSLAYAEYSFISHVASFLMAAEDEKIALGHGSSSSSGLKPKETITSSKVYRKVFRRAPHLQRASMAA
jgi:hypothetical protein